MIAKLAEYWVYYTIVFALTGAYIIYKQGRLILSLIGGSISVLNFALDPKKQEAESEPSPDEEEMKAEVKSFLFGILTTIIASIINAIALVLTIVSLLYNATH